MPGKPPSPKPIHPDVPTDRAWKEGRRLYVRCGKYSRLNTELRELGARWEQEHRALWLGSGKLEKVVEAITRAEERRARIERVKAEGRWVVIPYEAADIREAAKAADAVWDETSKRWALPDDASFQQIRDAVTAWEAEVERQRAARAEARRRQAEQDKADQQAQAQQEAESRRERLLAASGRTATGETAKLCEVSTQYMNKRTARETARRLGSLVTFDDGRRGVVVDVDVWFTGEEIASSMCWHPETHDEAHWDFDYTVAIVEPTEAERERDAARERERADARQVHELMEDAARLTAARAVEDGAGWAVIEQAGCITGFAGTPGTSSFKTGTLILGRDGTVTWRHPGYYDDYIRTEGTSSDPELVARVRAVLDGGNRTRAVADQLIHTYVIEVDTPA